MEIRWDTLLDPAARIEGASGDVIAEFIRTVLAPLSQAEITAANAFQKNPFPASHPLHQSYKPFDAGKWVLPSFGLPGSYLSFLRWSDGGNFVVGDREFGFFPAIDEKCGVRTMLLEYQLPEYMPHAVPFAFDGAGTFYLFDMRRPPVNDEFPIVMSHAGSLGWDDYDHEFLAKSFVDALSNS